MSEIWSYEDLNSTLILVTHGWVRKISILSRDKNEKPEGDDWWRCFAKLLNPDRYRFVGDPVEIESSKAIFDLMLFKQTSYLDQYKEKISEFERSSGALGRLGHVEANLFSGFLVIADEPCEAVLEAAKSGVQSIQLHLSVGRIDTNPIDSVWNISAMPRLIARVDQLDFLYGKSLYDIKNQI